MRRSECCSICWSDFDFEIGTIHIRNTWTWIAVKVFESNTNIKSNTKIQDKIDMQTLDKLPQVFDIRIEVSDGISIFGRNSGAYPVEISIKGR